MRHRRPSGEILPSLLSGLAGVIVGVIIVMTVITPNLQNDPPAPSAPEAAVQRPQPQAQSPVRNLFGTGQAADTKSIPDAVAKVEPAVVTIDTTTVKRVYERGLMGLPAYSTHLQEIPQGMGTGLLISTDGMIVTNNHVIKGAKTIHVTLNDRSQYTAKVLGTDAVSDIAILKIADDKPFPVAELASSEKVRIGEWVATIGNPLGVGQTVTVGVLSARGRNITDKSVELRDLLQTDAAINPGNSGGPLINVQGRVIGINTAIIPYAQGIGFAIPSESVTKIIESIRTNGRVIRPYLGIEMCDLTPAICRYLELPQNVNGVVVGRMLPDSPAIKAGLKAGDVITAIAGQSLRNAYELQGIVRTLDVGATVKISIIRDGNSLELPLTLEESPVTRSAGAANPNIKTAVMER